LPLKDTMNRLMLFIALLFCSARVGAADEGLLLHWKFDEGRDNIVRDATGQGASGQVMAGWASSPSGSAAWFDGTPATVVKTELPPGKRIGKASWTVMGWVKPQQFTIDSRQNQRRLFAYGAYPQAFFCVDISGAGAISLYQVHETAGKAISSGAGSSTSLALGQWAHVAVVCDRKTRSNAIYINGRLRGEQKLAPEFDGDFSVSGEFTVGNPWQNYWGLADEVRLYRRALARGEIRAEFDRLKGAFNVTPTAAEAESDAREAIQQAFAAANQAGAKRDFVTARKRLASIIANAKAPSHYRSYAHLRLAQSYVADGKAGQAKSEYTKIAAVTTYPQVHRDEARELVRELERTRRGLPPRDPAATRVTAPPLVPPRYRIFVSPKGKNTNTGTAEKPLATLAKARDRAREVLMKGAGGVEIVLAPGEYSVSDTLELSARNSGTATAPLVYRAQQAGTAVLYGGKRLSGFAPVTDAAILERLPDAARDKVRQLNLKTRGITDYGALAVRGFGQPPSPPTLELYVNRQPMTLARWPNTGFVRPTKLVEPGSKAEGKPSVLGYEDERHARWTNAKDAWLFGYFHFLWADATAKIAHIDPVAKTITTAEGYKYGDGGMSTEQGIIYYVFNLLEEIDQPGEWYLDRDNGVLYLYPPTDLSKATVELSMLSKPMISATKLANVRFEGLVFDLARGDGIVLNDSTNCQLVGCTVKRMAGNGISILGGKRNMLLSCDVHTIGRRATEVMGGDRETLTPSAHVVANCRIHNFGRIDRTYTPGVQLEGVGNRVTHNLFYNCPSSVMRIEGNDHIIEYNEVRDAVLESDDQGAMELFANPTYRGVVFRHNLFRRIGSGTGKQMVHGQAGIRFDDAISGMLVYGNIFDQAANGNFGGVQMNSGRDNIMDNNFFVDCEQGISGGYYPGNNVWKQLRAGQKSEAIFTNQLYVKRYPKIATMLDEPALNYVWRNVFYRCGRDVSGNRTTLDELANAVFTAQDPVAVDAAGNLRLKSAVPRFDAIGFRPIPLREIGLYSDQWRSVRPAAAPQAHRSRK
jgi:parallel beta-helix repeat protein